MTTTNMTYYQLKAYQEIQLVPPDGASRQEAADSIHEQINKLSAEYGGFHAVAMTMLMTENMAKKIQRWFRSLKECECCTIAVEMTFVNGKEYLIDRDTMHLYDIDTHLCMGQLDVRSMTIK